MLRMKYALQMVVCCGMLAIATGCAGMPPSGRAYDERRSTPGNHLYLNRLGLDINEDTEVTMTGVDLGRDGMFSNHFRASLITLKNGRASWEGVHGAQDRETIQRAQYFQHVNDVMDRVPAILDRFVPLAKDYLAMAGNVAMQKAMRPTLLQQIAAGLMGQHFDLGLVKGVFDPIDSSIATDAGALLKTQVPGVVVPAAANESKPPGTPARSEKPLQAKYALISEDELIELNPG